MLNTPLSNAEHTETETSGEPSKNLFQRNNTSNALTLIECADPHDNQQF